MIGDTLSHASLAGVTIGLMCGQNPVLGAFLFTSFCGALIEFLRSYFKKYTDLILTVVLSLSVGTAITIISSGKLHANADSFLFGSILTVTKFDMAMVLILSLISVLTLIVLYHQMIYIAYDEEAAKVAGVRVRLINFHSGRLCHFYFHSDRRRSGSQFHDCPPCRDGAAAGKGLSAYVPVLHRFQFSRYHARAFSLLLPECGARRLYRAGFCCDARIGTGRKANREKGSFLQRQPGFVKTGRKILDFNE